MATAESVMIVDRVLTLGEDEFAELDERYPASVKSYGAKGFLTITLPGALAIRTAGGDYLLVNN